MISLFLRRIQNSEITIQFIIANMDITSKNFASESAPPTEIYFLSIFSYQIFMVSLYLSTSLWSSFSYSYLSEPISSISCSLSFNPVYSTASYKKTILLFRMSDFLLEMTPFTGRLSPFIIKNIFPFTISHSFKRLFPM